MNDIPISDSKKRMGRPPMGVTPMLVRFPTGIAKRIDKIAGKNRRAAFIRKAVEAELIRREAAAKGKRPNPS